MHKFIALLSIVTLQGCAILSESVTEAAHNVGEGVTFYCNNTDVYVREQFALLVNEGAAPNSITVTCVNGYRLDPSTPVISAPAESAPSE